MILRWNLSNWVKSFWKIEFIVDYCHQITLDWAEYDLLNKMISNTAWIMHIAYGILVILLAVVVLLRPRFGEGCHWWDRINQGWPIKPHWLTASVPWIINFVPDHISLPQRNRSSRNIHHFRQYVLRIYHDSWFMRAIFSTSKLSIPPIWHGHMTNLI